MKHTIKNNLVTLYTIISILLIAGTNYNMAMEFSKIYLESFIPINCSNPQDQIFLELLAMNNQQLPTTDEQTINDNDIQSSNTSKKRSRAEKKIIQNQQNKKQKTSTQKPICSQCNKIFYNTYNLKKHLIIHTNEQPFICSHCNKTFKHKQNLQEHIKLHSDEKPYTCNHCNKKYKRKDTLTKHIQTKHTENKEYFCHYTDCNKIFKTPSGLTAHIQVIHTNIRYSCSECDKRYTKKDNLITHINNHH